jgi:uncharacterized protein YbaR (Trm112 family)
MRRLADKDGRPVNWLLACPKCKRRGYITDWLKPIDDKKVKFICPYCKKEFILEEME